MGSGAESLIVSDFDLFSELQNVTKKGRNIRIKKPANTLNMVIVVIEDSG